MMHCHCDTVHCQYEDYCYCYRADAVLPGGITATEQRSLSLDSDGNLRTQTLEQQFGGRLMPGSEPVTLVRQSSQQVTNKENSSEDAL